MTKTVVGSFDSYREAQQVVQELERSGIAHGDINIVASNLRDEYRAPDAGADPGTAGRTSAGVSDTRTTAGTGYESGAPGTGYSGLATAGTAAGPSAVGDNDAGFTSAPAKTIDADASTAQTTSSAASGAVTGGVIGGVAGLALAFTSLTIPVLGPIIAAGPIVAALTGAGVGAVAGGLIGGLTDIGVNDEDAQYYAESVRRGGALVTVRAEDMRADEVTRVMQRHGAIDINKRAETWRSSGWEGFENDARPYSVDDLERERSVTSRTTTPRTSSDWGMYADDFRADFDHEYSGRGVRYEDYEPSYRWGFENADSYRGRDWESSEADVRRDWERSNPGGEWEKFKNAVRRGWDRMTSGADHTIGGDDDRTLRNPRM